MILSTCHELEREAGHIQHQPSRQFLGIGFYIVDLYIFRLPSRHNKVLVNMLVSCHMAACFSNEFGNIIIG